MGPNVRGALKRATDSGRTALKNVSERVENSTPVVAAHLGQIHRSAGVLDDRDDTQVHVNINGGTPRVVVDTTFAALADNRASKHLRKLSSAVDKLDGDFEMPVDDDHTVDNDIIVAES